MDGVITRRGIINQTLISIGLINEPLPLINSLAGVVIGMVYVMLPFMILPLSLPGVATGSIIVFVMTLGYYIIPSLLGGTEQIMLGEFIADQIQSHLNWGIGATAGTVLVLIRMVFFVIYLRVSNGDAQEE